ncbi:sugar kinase [Brucella pseudogrignonensis]|uniref:carbohydrate kinase family protein n=1 Tax=Brucella pseudogrignonensis TaxID=419475 RepID=UPI0028B54BD3|nr:sugar kinase [Brucella pseudogrignonensis]MDT6941986.1 sugar kinase [Brucella pseudogrignonensis]
MSHDVSVIGLYILDVLGRPVDAIPPGGNVEFIDEIRLTVAGTAGGTVVDLAKLGLNCLAVGAVGDDEKADFVLATLQRFGVDVAQMQRLKGFPTSSTILNIRRNGDRPALHARGASDHFEVLDSAVDAVLAPPIIHLGGTGLLAKLDGEPSRKLLAEAKARGRITTFDLLGANDSTLDLISPLFPHIDYFMPSIEEAKQISGAAGVEGAGRFFIERGVKHCVFTLGGDGVCFMDSTGAVLRQPAFQIEVVDTTGCGDAFDAGFITALHRKMDVKTALNFAQASAALVATGLGSDAGIRSFEDTLNFMNTAAIKQ